MSIQEEKMITVTSEGLKEYNIKEMNEQNNKKCFRIDKTFINISRVIY